MMIISGGVLPGRRYGYRYGYPGIRPGYPVPVPVPVPVGADFADSANKVNMADGHGVSVSVSLDANACNITPLRVAVKAIG